MSGEERRSLADRVAALRDEVLATADDGDREPPGSEVFDAVLRILSAGDAADEQAASSRGNRGDAVDGAGAHQGAGVADLVDPAGATSTTISGPAPAGSSSRPSRSRGSPLADDLALHDGIARRLAWRDSELRVLSDAGEVCRRLLAAARRALRDPDEEMEVAQAVAKAGSAAARILILLVLGRVGRERAALLREELAHDRLGHAVERQRQELARLQRALGEEPPP